MDIALIIISSLISGIAGVIISIFYHRQSDKKQTKIDVLRNFVGYRHDLTGNEFTKALNEIFVVFCDSPEIQIKVKDLHEVLSSKLGSAIANDRLYKLFIAMCNDLKINTSTIEESSFINTFNVKK